MLTPALATGAAAGTLLVLTINALAGHHVSVPAVSLAGAAGVLAVTQRAPIWAAIFVWELARPPLWLLLVFLVDRLERLRVAAPRRSAARALLRPERAGQVRVALGHVAQREVPAVLPSGRRTARRWRAARPACRTAPSTAPRRASCPSMLANTAAALNIPWAIDSREAEQLGADRAGVDRVVVTADRGVATDLAGRDPQDRVGRRQLRLFLRRRLGFVGQAGALLVQERRDLVPGGVIADADVGDHVHQQSLAVFAEVLRVHRRCRRCRSPRWGGTG